LTVTRRDLSRLSRSRGIAGRPRPTTRRRHREGPPAAARPRQGRGVARRGAGATAGLAPNLSVVFKLPWPWGGERFELRDNRPLNYIIGPLGSGKTRLAKRISEALPDTAFLGLDRLADGGAAARARLDADPALNSRVDQILAWLVEDGGMASEA
jgi:hypothetical protein